MKRLLTTAALVLFLSSLAKAQTAVQFTPSQIGELEAAVIGMPILADAWQGALNELLWLDGQVQAHAAILSSLAAGATALQAPRTLPYIIGMSRNGNWGPPGINQVRLIGFILPAAQQFSRLSVFVTTVDATNLYDVGIYDSSGKLVADIGPVNLPTLNAATFSLRQGTVTLPAGKYYFAFTGNASTARISGNDSFNWNFAANVAASAGSAGGQLPAAISPPADAWVSNGPGGDFLLF